MPYLPEQPEQQTMPEPRKGKKIPLCNTGKNVDNLDTTIVEYLEG